MQAFIVVTTVMVNQEFHSSHVEEDEGKVCVFRDKTFAMGRVDQVVDQMVENIIGEDEFFSIEREADGLNGGSKIYGSVTEVFITIQDVEI